jgi:serine/threonine protein kinase
LRDTALLTLLLDDMEQGHADDMRARLDIPAYLFPPHLDSATDPKARDLYGLGVILFEMLTGQVPFTSETSELSVPEQAIAHLPPRLSMFLLEFLNRRSVHHTAGTIAHNFRAIVEGTQLTSKPASSVASDREHAPSEPLPSASTSSTPARELPQHIGRYVIEEELGRGAMGVVYLAHDPYVNRYVAVKSLTQELSTNTHFSDLFRREAQLVATLEHPHIVRVYDFGEHEGQLFIVMHYLSGGTLSDRFRKGPMSLRELAPIIQQVAQALDEAHVHGIIHRDVKPGNILFNTHGEAVLSDFGIAVLPQGTGTSGENEIAGTPYYMSPEQARIQPDAGREPDGRSDIYSLGVVLYEGLIGRVPFKGTQTYDTMLAHVMQPVPRMRQQRADLPPGCQEVIDRVMAKDPADRYPTAREFAQDVKELVSGRWFLRKIT